MPGAGVSRGERARGKSAAAHREPTTAQGERFETRGRRLNVATATRPTGIVSGNPIMNAGTREAAAMTTKPPTCWTPEPEPVNELSVPSTIRGTTTSAQPTPGATAPSTRPVANGRSVVATRGAERYPSTAATGMP